MIFVSLLKSFPHSRTKTKNFSFIVTVFEQNSRNSNYEYFLENSFETKRNIAASYDTAAMVCVTCALKLGHKILLKRDTKAPHEYSSPAVFVLVDRSFPAYLHAHRR